jgi:hypothetical protein
LSQTDTEKKVDQLCQMGYRRQDIKVLPDGQVIIEPLDEARDTSFAVSRATRKQRLERLTGQLETLQQQNPTPERDSKIAELTGRIQEILAE